MAKSFWESVPHYSAFFCPSCSFQGYHPFHLSESSGKYLTLPQRCYFLVFFPQVLTHLSLVLLHLVFISVNLPQQIFNSLVTELVPFVAALIQLSHLSYQKRGDLGRGEG